MKHKTHKGLAKRIKKIGSKKNEKLVHYPQGDSHHLRSKKSAKRKNRMNTMSVMGGKVQIKSVKSLI